MEASPDKLEELEKNFYRITEVLQTPVIVILIHTGNDLTSNKKLLRPYVARTGNVPMIHLSISPIQEYAKDQL